MYDHKDPKTGGHALVIGCSMAGLLAARELSTKDAGAPALAPALAGGVQPHRAAHRALPSLRRREGAAAGVSRRSRAFALPAKRELPEAA
jgi:hypothetical protein